MKELGFLLIITSLLLSGCMVPRRLEGARETLRVQATEGGLQASVNVGTLGLLGRELKRDFLGTSRDLVIDVALLAGTGFLVKEGLEAQQDEETTVINNEAETALSTKSSAVAQPGKDANQFDNSAPACQIINSPDAICNFHTGAL